MTTDKPTPQQQIAALMQRGMEASRAGQHARARRYFTAVLAIDPTCLEAWLQRAAVAAGPEEAMADLSRVLALSPRHPQARAMLRAARRNRTSGAPAAGPGGAAPAIVPVVAPHRRRAGYWLGWGLLVLSVGLMLALAASPAGPRRVVAALIATDTPTPTPTYTPTPTPTPTDTPTPTPTHTPTPTPTDTPTPTPTPTRTPTPLPADRSAAGRWIEIDLSEQRLYAHEGQNTVLNVLVSTGTRYHPTLTGRFKIYVKYRSTLMTGPGYYLPNVPYTMYFYGGYGIHGTYWHSNFGHPMSHGCVNMKTSEAKWLFNWASVGTLVVIHR